MGSNLIEEIDNIQAKLDNMASGLSSLPSSSNTCSLITVKPESTYGLRSNNSTLLLPPAQKMLPTLGARSFAAAPPTLWNNLPADIRNVASFK